MATSAGGGPANLLAVNVGGVNLSYDLGPSNATVASQAYSFLNNSFSNDTNLLQGAITGANNLVSGLASPVIQMAQTQQQFNTTVLPSMFDQLNDQNYSLGLDAESTAQATAQASIAASTAEAANAPKGGGGGCYITTAVCESMGMPDDCKILTTLRRFRDTFMHGDESRTQLVREYYDSAPTLVEFILACEDASARLALLFTRYIKPAVEAIEAGDNFGALVLYKAMVADVKDCFRPIDREVM